MKVEKPKEKYDQLIADGYCIVENVLKVEMKRIAELAPICDGDVEPLKWNLNLGPELR